MKVVREYELVKVWRAGRSWRVGLTFFQRQFNKAGGVPLQEFFWRRIILDEGHEIIRNLLWGTGGMLLFFFELRGRRTRRQRASGQRDLPFSDAPVEARKKKMPIQRFHSQFRWFVSGTPFPSLYALALLSPFFVRPLPLPLPVS